ncbi:hypothetical protein CEP54_013146 [Fusarium duplospermum]|uniref:Uncharacterized protein n=1 Tax=Fusarium duplospermum TaxID=1325734 RepID=A0A428P4K3_9HYPO|nr:hypothetical protein CEP54_013146 [Fusarium duplospermum]
MASKEDTLVQALSSSLTEQQTQKVIHTTPPGFDKAIRSLPRADRVSSAFQAAGIWAWISYFLVASHNDEIEESLSQLPEPTLQYVISEVSKVKASPSLITRIQHTLYHSHRAATRRIT